MKPDFFTLPAANPAPWLSI